MAELKTKKNNASVTAFVKGIEDPQKRKDCQAIAKMMRAATGARAKMWGETIVGYGDWHYKYASGRDADWFQVGFSPRKQNITVYIMNGFSTYEKLLAKLGKHKTGKSCLYIKRLSDVDVDVLEALINASAEAIRKRNSQAN